MTSGVTNVLQSELKDAFAGGLSIIVPCGRPERAQGTLTAILAQEWLPESTELILVGVSVAGLAAQVGRNTKMRICVVTLPERSNPAQTRISGARVAKGSHLLFVDDDIELSRDFLIGLSRVLSGQPPACVGPRLPCRNRTYFARVVDLANFWSQQSPSAGPRDWLYSAALYVDAAIYHEIGGFRPDLDIGEDVELTSKIAATGRVVWYAGDLIAVHNHGRTNLGSALRYFWGNGKLAWHLYPPDPKLDYFRMRNVCRNFVVNVRATLGANWGARGLGFYLPGIFLMYLLLVVSLEAERLRIRLAMAASTQACPVPRGRRAGQLFERACVAHRKGAEGRAFRLYLVAGIAEKFVR